MSKISNILMVALLLSVSGLWVLTASCKTNYIVPYMPPNYYNCLEVNVDDLLKNYFSRYGNIYLAEQTYNGKAFVFKGVRVYDNMLLDKDTFALSTAKFVASESGAVGKLKAGMGVDIVGICKGPLPEAEGIPLASWFDSEGSPLTVAFVPGWLLFTDCIFLRAGAVQLPAPGGSVFAPLY